MDVRDLRLSNHKDLHPEDSDNPADIGLSSEEEADNLDEHPAIRRKYHQTSQPTVTTASTTGGSTSTVTTATTTSSTSTDPQMATIQIPVTALQQVHSMLGQMLQGQVPDVPQQAPVPPAPLEPAEDMPFSVTRPKRGEKQCTVCQRKFWSTDTLRRHIKSHTASSSTSAPIQDVGGSCPPRGLMTLISPPVRRRRPNFARRQVATSSLLLRQFYKHTRPLTSP